MTDQDAHDDAHRADVHVDDARGDESDVRPGAPSDNTTLTAVLAELDAQGYAGSFGARDGARLFCSACRETSPAAEFRIDATRRMEGASDPGAELMVAVGACPACGARGTAVLSYGPEASEEDALVVAALDLTRG